MRLFSPSIFLFLIAMATPVLSRAAVQIDSTDADFTKKVQAELESMRTGTRGIAAKSLVARLDASTATTTVKVLGLDESTWHPNDHRGTRSHVVAADTRIRGSERRKPTSAILYLHKTRIDPSFSLFKLGTFVHELSFAADLNEGKFSGDFKIREKRATFYRNGWLDSFNLKPILVSDRVPTPEYSKAKELGLITEGNAPNFPVLDVSPAPSPSPDPVP